MSIPTTGTVNTNGIDSSDKISHSWYDHKMSTSWTDDMADDIWIDILCFLKIMDFICLRQTCKHFIEVTKCPRSGRIKDYWQDHTKNLFESFMLPYDHNYTANNWESVYKESKHVLKHLKHLHNGKKHNVVKPYYTLKSSKSQTDTANNTKNEEISENKEVAIQHAYLYRNFYYINATFRNDIDNIGSLEVFVTSIEYDYVNLFQMLMTCHEEYDCNMVIDIIVQKPRYNYWYNNNYEYKYDNIRNATPLYIASKNGSINIVRLLLSKYKTTIDFRIIANELG